MSKRVSLSWLELPSMMNCPKCGFDQPKDQFCASCGIDMERYALAHRPRRFRGLPPLSVWLGAGSVVVILLIAFLVLEPFSYVLRTSGDPSLALEEERIESFGRLDLGQRRALSSEPGDSLTSEPAVESVQPLVPAPAQPVAQLQPQFSLVLISSSVLARWIRDASDFSSGQGLSSGVLSPDELAGVGAEDQVISLNAQEVLGTGWASMSPLSELGMDSAGFSLEADLDGSQLDLAALSIAPEQRIESGISTWNEVETAQRWTFDLSGGGTLFVVGLLPRPPQIPRTAPWNLPGLLELWDLEEFVEGDRELVLLIEPAVDRQP